MSEGLAFFNFSRALPDGFSYCVARPVLTPRTKAQIQIVMRSTMNSTRMCLLAFVMTAIPASVPMATQAFAQDSRPMLTQADWNALTNERIAVVKAALQLTPDQQKYWPAIEEAIRARAQTRQQRLASIEERLDQQPLSVDPIDFLHKRADALVQRGTSLKNLADAWQPLYQSLNPDQKRRMRLLMVDVLRDLRDAVQTRGIEATGRGG